MVQIEELDPQTNEPIEAMSDPALESILNMGFDREQAKHMLDLAEGNQEYAVEMLLAAAAPCAGKRTQLDGDDTVERATLEQSQASTEAADDLEQSICDKSAAFFPAVSRAVNITGETAHLVPGTDAQSDVPDCDAQFASGLLYWTNTGTTVGSVQDFLQGPPVLQGEPQSGGLSQYAAALNGFEPCALREEAKLAAAGVSKIFHRKRLVRWANNLSIK